MKIAVRARLPAIAITGVAALATLVVGPALPSTPDEPWVSTPSQNLAFVTGFHCNAAAKRQRDLGNPIPPECVNSRWNAIINPPPGDAPPPDDSPAPQP